MAEHSPEEDDTQKEMGFLSHLVELRDRLLRMVIAIGVVFACLFPFSNQIYTFLSGPLTEHLPEGSSMIAIDVASPFLAPFKLVLMLSVVLTIPVILHQAWSFVAPGLYRHEKRIAMPLLVSSVILFYLGMAFAYYVVFPLVFGFFTSIAPEGVEVMTDINRYLDFVVTLFLAFGISFEVPVATVLLIMTGVTTAEKLSGMRPYIVVAAFVVGMLLTPPDVVSQIMLAIPIWMLFELGLLASRFLATPEKDEETRDIGGEAAAAGASQASPRESAVAQALIDEDAWRPMTDEEMEEELKAIEEAEEEAAGEEDVGDDKDDDQPDGEK
ncbi:MAG TPA: twin-arginine translocase subunit TatC [Gammaproteobacteria bacterium]|nr:twin-arginine translocase subunit TatC [Gammaproteobacteria bacterium]